MRQISFISSLRKISKLFIVCAILLCTFTACKKDDNDAPLIGTWIHTNMSYTFNSDGSGYSTNDGTSWGGHLCISHYKWKHTSSMLHLTFDGSGCTGAGTQSYYYTIENGVLSLWYEDGDFKGAYIKQ